MAMQRKHTTTACQVCRDHKTKCDGNMPICGRCAQKGKPCIYSNKDDKRKVSLRNAVDVLLIRVEQLTSLIIEHAIPLPPIPADHESLIEQVCSQLERDLSKVVPQDSDKPAWLPPEAPADQMPLITSGEQYTDVINGQAGDSATLINSIQSNPSIQYDMNDPVDLFMQDSWEVSPSDWPWQLLNDVNAQYDISGLPVDLGHDKGLRVEDPTSSAASDDEVEVNIVPDLAARFGSLRLDAEGRIRFYGSASNQHLFANSSAHREQIISKQDKKRDVALALENSHLDREIPVELEERLLNLFFEWHNTCHSLIDRRLFDAARKENPDQQSQYCSQSLLAAMCAVGAAFEGRYHPTFVTFPKPLAEFFADKSKILLELEIDSPCVSTVQTMVLLSGHEAGAGRDTRLWLYSGMAARLTFDIGLHVDSDPYVKTGMFTKAESEARRTAFWSCIVINQLWSFSLGRPFRVDSEELTVKRLGNDSEDSSASWPDLPSTTSWHSPASVDPSLSRLILDQWIKLADELAPLVRILYGCVTISKSTLQTLSNETTKNLLNWRETIPYVLRVQTGQPTIPQVLFLHLAYHNFCILIHRPWTSRSSQPSGNIDPGHHHARKVCRNAASEIASLLRVSEEHYGFRTMHVYVVTIIFSASLILIFGLTAAAESIHAHDREANDKLAGDLNTCFRALEELGRSYECAKRTRDRLLELQQLWSQRKEEARIETKRSRSGKHETSDVRKKRIRS